MNQHPQPRLPDPGQPEYKPPIAITYVPRDAWESAPKAVRFAVWVWAISVIAGLALAAVFMVLFAIGMNVAMLGGR